MARRLALALMLSAATLLEARGAAAAVVAFDAAAGQPGNQAWTGSLGTLFQVDEPVSVTSLGVFDSNGDGIAGSIQVGMFFASGPNTGTLVPGLSTSFTGSGDTLVHGDRFRAVAAPVVLAPGSYEIVAQGFSATDLDGNVRCMAAVPGGACLPANAFSLSTLNDGGGAITFGNGAAEANFFSSEGSGFVNPVGLLAESPAVPNAYLAGTFAFEVVPEPASFELMGLGLVALALVRRARTARDAHTHASSLGDSAA
jgi:hypothetical protein